jgi:hypothetical protein
MGLNFERRGKRDFEGYLSLIFIQNVRTPDFEVFFVFMASSGGVHTLPLRRTKQASVEPSWIAS